MHIRHSLQAVRLIRAAARACGVATFNPVRGDIRLGSASVGPKLRQLTLTDATAIMPSRWARAARAKHRELLPKAVAALGFNSSSIDAVASTPGACTQLFQKERTREFRVGHGWVDVDGERQITPLERRLAFQKAERDVARGEVAEREILQCVISFGAGGSVRENFEKLAALPSRLSRSLRRSETQSAELVLSGLQVAIRPSKTGPGSWIVEPHLHVGFLVEADFRKAEVERLRAFLKPRTGGAKLTFWHRRVRTRAHLRNWLGYMLEHPVAAYRVGDFLKPRGMPLEAAVMSGFRDLEAVIDMLHTPADEENGTRVLRTLVTAYGSLTDRVKSAEARWGKCCLGNAGAVETEAQKKTREEYAAAQREAEEGAVGIAGATGFVPGPDEVCNPEQDYSPEPPDEPRERVLRWKLCWCPALRRKSWMVVVKDPQSGDYRELLNRLLGDFEDASFARSALADLDEVEGRQPAFVVVDKVAEERARVTRLEAVKAAASRLLVELKSRPVSDAERARHREAEERVKREREAWLAVVLPRMFPAQAVKVLTQGEYARWDSQREETRLAWLAECAAKVDAARAARAVSGGNGRCEKIAPTTRNGPPKPYPSSAMNISKTFKNEVVRLLTERVAARVTALNHGLIIEAVQPVLVARLEAEAIAAVEAAIAGVADGVTGRDVFTIYRDLTMKKRAASQQVTAPKETPKASVSKAGVQGGTPSA